jgi:hypothetical protein
MKKDTIIQFVCFITDLGLDEFIPKWERYAKRFMKADTTSLQQAETKSRFRYVSQHECSDGGFQFTFMNEKRSEHFPEHNVKVVQAGGYIPLQVECRHNEETGISKLIAFISHDDMDIDSYRQLPSYRYLNIYQAYYENCAYAYIMEYFLPDEEVSDLLQLLKRKNSVEIVRYKECLVPEV